MAVIGGGVLLAAIGTGAAVLSVATRHPARVAGSAPASITPGAETTVQATARTTSPGGGAGVIQIGADRYAAYSDGLQVAVTSARRATFSNPSSSPSPGVIVTIIMRNGSDANLSLEVANVVLRYGAQRSEADWMYDDSLHIFSGDLGPGQTATASYGFAIPPRERDITVEVTPDTNHDSTTFTGRVN